MTLFQLAPLFGTIKTPSQLSGVAGLSGGDAISFILNRAVFLFFSFAAVAFIIMFLWGAVQMVISAGDKEAVAKARGKITWAIIGVVLLSLAFFIFEVLEQITGFKFFL
jgi:hypothetical protein